jgi:hypothetical protein
LLGRCRTHARWMCKLSIHFDRVFLFWLPINHFGVMRGVNKVPSTQPRWSPWWLHSAQAQTEENTKKTFNKQFFTTSTGSSHSTSISYQFKNYKKFNEVDASVGCEVGLSGADVYESCCTCETATVDDSRQPRRVTKFRQTSSPHLDLFSTHIKNRHDVSKTHIYRFVIARLTTKKEEFLVLVWRSVWMWLRNRGKILTRYLSWVTRNIVWTEIRVERGDKMQFMSS